MRPYYIAAIVVCTFAATFVGCAVLQAFRPALPAIAAALLAELDNVLDAYEDASTYNHLGPEAAGQMEDLQTARRSLIECIIDQRAEEYPEITLTRRLERLNNATGLPPP